MERRRFLFVSTARFLRKTLIPNIGLSQDNLLNREQYAVITISIFSAYFLPATRAAHIFQNKVDESNQTVLSDYLEKL